VRVSERAFERLENGDRAIDPLYPSFIISAGPLQVLSDPLYSELTGAIAAALNETGARLPVARALMRSDVWAAYDILFRARADGPAIREHREALLSLLRQFLQKLALIRRDPNIGFKLRRRRAILASAGPLQSR